MLCGTVACSTSEPQKNTAETAHGYVVGATEQKEPQVSLTTVDRQGKISLLNLLTEDVHSFPQQSAVAGLETDGRFVFAQTESGVSVLDTGVWKVDHEDHVHYYRAKPVVVGTLSGDGEAIIVSGQHNTAITFKKSGEGVLLDTKKLAAGEIVETNRLKADMLVPLDKLTVTAAQDKLAIEGQADARVPCVEPQGTATTPVGVLIGCANGAVLATSNKGKGKLELIPYPRSLKSTARATAFQGRAGRPTVAALGGSKEIWLLQTRQKSWKKLATEKPILRVVAADDSQAHVVALAADGSILTLDGRTGKTLSATPALLAETVKNESLLNTVRLTVNGQRAYINAPAEGKIHEIDFADKSRVARTFSASRTPLFSVITGS